MSVDEIRARDWVEHSPDAPYRIEGRWLVASIKDVGDGVSYAVFEDGNAANVRHLRRTVEANGAHDEVTETSQRTTTEDG